MNEKERFRATHLAKILEQNERSQSWLARKVGVSQALMNYIVNGERTMSREVADSIAEIFNVPLFLFCESTSVQEKDAVMQSGKAA